MLIDVKAALAEILNEGAAIPAISAIPCNKPMESFTNEAADRSAIPAIPAIQNRRAGDKSQESRSQGSHPGSLAIFAKPLPKLANMCAPGAQSRPKSRESQESRLPGGEDGNLPPYESGLEGERAAIAVEDGGIPSVYAMAWAHLQAGPPVGIDHTRWMQARADAGAFLDKWGAAAARLGWPVHHLFEAPRGWIGGLVWEIGGGAVVALTDRQAIIAQGTRKLWFCIPPHTGHDRETRNG